MHQVAAPPYAGAVGTPGMVGDVSTAANMAGACVSAVDGMALVVCGLAVTDEMSAMCSVDMAMN